VSAAAPSPASAGRAIVPVAVGVLVRGDGAVLLADRPAGKPYAGHWEFPGGKIEAGESVGQALERELHEELGLRAAGSVPWVVIEHDYPHAYVRLHFRRILDFAGAPRPLEGQRLLYHVPGDPPPAPLLPAAVPALRWIRLSAVIGRSPGDCRTAAEALAWLDAALGRGLRQIVWHEPALDRAAAAAAWPAACELARSYGALLLAAANAAPPADPGADVFLGVGALRAATRRPPADWVGAAVADRSDLDRAARLACDFAVLEGWPDAAAPPAWDDCPLPCYLEAPLDLAIMQRARGRGFHGLAIARLP